MQALSNEFRAVSRISHLSSQMTDAACGILRSADIIQQQYAVLNTPNKFIKYEALEVLNRERDKLLNLAKHINYHAEYHCKEMQLPKEVYRYNFRKFYIRIMKNPYKFIMRRYFK